MTHHPLRDNLHCVGPASGLQSQSIAAGECQKAPRPNRSLVISLPVIPSDGNDTRVIPLPVKIAYTLFVGVLVPVYWRHYGPANFLWFSDIALLLTVPALWLETSLLASMMALAVLLPELAWNLDFFVRLTTGARLIGLSAYMFDGGVARWLRALSLFHVGLPVLLLWMLARLGYDPRALIAQTALALIVLPLSYLLSDKRTNINWVYGWDEWSQMKFPAPWFLIFLLLMFPLVIYFPTHFLLDHFFGPAR